MSNLKEELRPDWSLSELYSFSLLIKSYIGEDITFVEIGSYVGESSCVFADVFKSGTIYCVDPWVGGFDSNDYISDVNYSEIEKQFDERTSNFKNIKKVKKFSNDFSLECDVVYIDGCHTYDCVKSDILHWLPLTKSFITGHDYYNDHMDRVQPHTAGVRKAVNEILGIPDFTFKDGSWIKFIEN